MSVHSWCHDTARDAAVRAAEDNRTEPLPTLGEAIAAVTESMSKDARGEEMEQGNFTDAAKRSSTVSKTGEGQSGMRTERVVLEITRPAIAYYPAPARHFMWQHLLRDVVQGDRESVRVVEEPVAWGFATPGGTLIHVSVFEPEQHPTVVPLYRDPPQPGGWLSGDERLALEAARTIIDGSGRTNIGATIAALLDRSSPPEVVLPDMSANNRCGGSEYCLGWTDAELDFRKALAAAGVAVKEVGRE